jgi:hypothetical protein
MNTSTQTPQEMKKPYRDTNKIEIAGQLGQNPEIVALTSGRIIVTGSLASHRNYVKDGQTAKKTNWVPFTYRGDNPKSSPMPYGRAIRFSSSVPSTTVNGLMSLHKPSGPPWKSPRSSTN